MMKTFLFPLAILFAVTALGQTDPAVPSPDTFQETRIPGISVDALEHDFGVVFWGSTVSHAFHVINRTEGAVSITSIRSDCGCTATIDTESPIQPGDRRQILVTYVPEYQEGLFTKTISVYTDLIDEASQNQWFELSVKGKIETVLSMDPWHVFYKKVFHGQSYDETMRIVADKDPSVVVESVRSSSEHLQVTLEKQDASEASAPEWLLTLTLKDSAPIGTFSETVTLTTSHPQQKEITAKVLAYVRGPITLNPTQCYIGTVHPGQIIEKRFVIDKTGESPDLKEPSISGHPDWITYSTEALKENARYALHVTLTIPESASGRLNAMFVVETHDDSVPRFEVPVFGYVIPAVSEAEEPADALSNPVPADNTPDNQNSDNQTSDSPTSGNQTPDSQTSVTEN